jgi:hypothetical protein
MSRIGLTITGMYASCAMDSASTMRDESMKRQPEWGRGIQRQTPGKTNSIIMGALAKCA